MTRAASALLVGLLVELCCGAWAMPAVAAELVPHRATFTLSLRAGGSPSILGVIGRIAFAYETACDGAVTRHAMQTLIRDAGGKVTDSRATMLLWERADGVEMTFETTATFDERPDPAYAGRATRAAVFGLVAYQVPGGNMQISPGTVFPSEHSRDVLVAAMRGERMLTQDVFQGGGPTNYMTVTAAISDPLPAAEGTDPALAGLRSWNVREAYFRPGGRSELPEHEFGFRLYEGGLIDALDLDFGPFRVVGKLANLEMLSAPRC